MNARRWDNSKAEAVLRQPWLAIPRQPKLSEPRSTPRIFAGPKVTSLPNARPVPSRRLASRFSFRYTRPLATQEWEIYIVNEVREWISNLDSADRARVVQAIDLLAGVGPGLGRPMVDSIRDSSIANLKELRPGNVRILFVFDPWRSSILLVAGDKAGQWQERYAEAIPLAEQRYETYLKERAEEEGRDL